MEEIIELKYTLKNLLNNLIVRIDSIVKELNEGNSERIPYFIDDLSVSLNAAKYLKQNNMLEVDLDELNDKIEKFLNVVENRNISSLIDNLIFELKPYLKYWSETISNG